MKKVIVICGPTAVGKTKLAIDVAKYFNFEIISGDSVSVYKKLDIGSAKPTLDEMCGIKHYLIDIKDPWDKYSVYDFMHDAREIIDNSNDIKIISGGTGLYISSCLYDYEFKSPKRDASFEERFKDYSNEELFEYLKKIDKNISNINIHPNNRNRVLRAIEVTEKTGKEFSSFNNKAKKVYDYFIIYLSMPREILYERINLRVDKMFDEGLLKEVKDLYDNNIMPDAIGYKEFIPYFKGLISLDDVKEEIKKNTRHLAKRQETWFRNQMDSHFYDLSKGYEISLDNILKDLKEFI
jgi:tRNA dimethylallyltransferase